MQGGEKSKNVRRSRVWGTGSKIAAWLSAASWAVPRRRPPENPSEASSAASRSALRRVRTRPRMDGPSGRLSSRDVQARWSPAARRPLSPPLGRCPIPNAPVRPRSRRSTPGEAVQWWRVQSARIRASSASRAPSLLTSGKKSTGGSDQRPEGAHHPGFYGWGAWRRNRRASPVPPGSSGPGSPRRCSPGSAIVIAPH